MSNGKSGLGQARRAIRALLIVAALIALVPAIDCAGSALKAGGVAARVIASAQDVRQPLDVGAVLGDEATVGHVSAAFEEEAFSFAALQGVRCSVDGSVVSFDVDGSPDQALLLVRDWLGQSGWSCQESGISGMASFSKGFGCYRWLFVSCLPAEGRTNVIVQGIKQYGEVETHG